MLLGRVGSSDEFRQILSADGGLAEQNSISDKLFNLGWRSEKLA